VSECRYVLGISVRFADICHCAIMLKMDWVIGGGYMILPAVSDRLHTFQFHCFRIIFLSTLWVPEFFMRNECFIFIY